MRKRLLLVAVPVVLLAGLGLLVARNARARSPRYALATLERGDVQESVGATGTLQAVTTVQVGSQVSGNIMTLGADFNSLVKRGQVVARLEPSTYEARVRQMEANLAAAVANVERAQATLGDARQKYERGRELLEQRLLAQSDYETAESTYRGALAALKASQAAVEQAEANLSQARVDLQHTIITAPIDGVVVARNVDIGQTVAASFQAPVLFVIANDLTRMQVKASIDEADIGRVQAGQPVTFRVDAYPERDFEGRIEQVRLQPVSAQNVVTYDTIISAENPEQRLMPGMTATVAVIVARRAGVLRLPAAALRFRPEGFVDARPSRAPGASEQAPAAGAVGRARGPGGSGKPRGAGGAAGEGAARGRRGLVFVLGEPGPPQATPGRTGLSDGRFVELLEGPPEGAKVITGAGDASVPRAANGGSSPGTTNPFAPGRPQPRSR